MKKQMIKETIEMNKPRVVTRQVNETTKIIGRLEEKDKRIKVPV